jgi:cob(I)alamin adenosyltransferase
MRIYTRTGDEGETGLFGGGRVSKAHPRVDAYGAVDELNAVIGVALAALADGRADGADHDGAHDGRADDRTMSVAAVAALLRDVQHDLFALGAHLATPPAAEGRRAPRLPPLPEDRIAALERAIDGADEQLPPLVAFILPGGSRAGAALHHARTVCRRAERRVIALASSDPVPPPLLAYLNRLSDLLFVLARLLNQRAGEAETEWVKASETDEKRGS